MSRSEAILVLGSVAAAGLALGAEVGGPVQAILALWLLLACPGLAITGLFQIPERLPRLVMVLAVSLTVDILAAEAILYTGKWSPADAYLVIAAITTVGVAASLFVQRAPAKTLEEAIARRVAVEELFQP